MQGVLEITILRAFLARDICPYMNMNPYFITYLDQNKNHISKPHFSGNHSPYWDEKCYFQTENHPYLYIDIMHEDQKVNNIITQDMLCSYKSPG
jgi:hypothetical protein